MLLPQTKEREYRFKLALRMGIPIFALVIALVSHTLIENYATLNPSFYVESTLLLLISIYFIFYLIYSGFNEKITDDISKTFSREYLLKYLQKELKKHKEYTFILISINNLSDINKVYGLNNGDMVIEKVAKFIANYLKSKNIENFPMGHIKGGDFVVGLEGHSNEYSTILELMCLKSNEFTVDDIEVKITGALIDTRYSNQINHMLEKLFELEEKNRNFKNRDDEENIDPNDLESYVIDAIDKKSIELMTQAVYEEKNLAFKECYVKLQTQEGKVLFPKTYQKVINKLGLGVEFDLMLLEELVFNYLYNSDETYAINVSPSSLRNEKYLLRAKELLKMSSKKIMFILSEQEYYSYTKRYNAILKSLQQRGALIAIDRLGSLHTSFLYLRELDVDVVRFDTYYSHQEKVEKNKSIIEGFVRMAKSKSIKTWIKNIESQDGYKMAQELQIDYIEGKFLANLEKIDKIEL